MLELLLVGMFTAFFLAVLEKLIDLISIFISTLLTNVTMSIAFSALGNYLVETETLKGFIIKTIAGAFLGQTLVTLAERLTVYRQVTIRQ